MQMYESTDTDFTHRGKSLPDAYNDLITWQLNNSFVLTFDYPLKGINGSEIDNEKVIKASTPDGENLFRITSRMKSMGTISVTAYQVFWDLSYNFIEDINNVESSGTKVIEHIMANTQFPHNFTYTSSISNLATARMVRMSVISALIGTDENSFLSRWGGEFDWQGFTFEVHAHIGEDRGVVFRNKKNLTGYKETIDTSTVVTRIMPEGYNGLLLPEKYVDSPLIKNYTLPHVAEITYSDVKAIDPTATDDSSTDDGAVPEVVALEELREAARKEFSENDIDKPSTTYELNVVMLENTEEYKNSAVFTRVYPGDTVTFIHDEDGIRAQARLTAYTWTPVREEYLTQTYASESRSPDLLTKIETVANKVQTVDDGIVSKAQSAVTNLFNSGMGGYVRVYPDKILIMDTDNEQTAQKVWQWSMSGLGFSSHGIAGPYESAMTSDGQIVADFIKAGTLNASLIKSGAISSNNDNVIFDLDAGTLNVKKGVLSDSEGLTSFNLTNGYITSWNKSTDIFSKAGTYGVSIEDGSVFFEWRKRKTDVPKVLSSIGTYNDSLFGLRDEMDINSQIPIHLKPKSYPDWETQVSPRTRLDAEFSGKNINIDAYDDEGSTPVEFFNNGNMVIGNNLDVHGSKNAIHATRDGVRATPAYEMAESYLGDMGEGQTDLTGQVTIPIDTLFSDTVNTAIPYQVFLQAYASGNVWIAERNEDNFIVKSNTPNLKFAWEIKAKRRGYEQERLRKTDVLYKDLEKMEGK